MFAGVDADKSGAIDADELRRAFAANPGLRSSRSGRKGGGFAGLVDAKEALEIGTAAQALQPAEKSTFAESDPTLFPGGAVYTTDEEARAARAAVDEGIRKLRAVT
jgi:hypothetical protein